MKKFNVRQVEAFRAVVTMGSMSKAAKLLEVSQPAVSRLVSDFQQAVGFKLFRRVRNGAEPSQDAWKLFVHVEKLFTGLEELGSEVEAIKSLTSGKLTVAATSSYTSGILPALTTGFRAQFPDINFSYRTMHHEQVLDWVTSGAADVGFTTQENGVTSLNLETLLKGEMVCALPRDHPLAAKSDLSLDDLRGEPFISFPRGTPFRFGIDQLFDRSGIDRVLTLDATTHEAICAFVARGLGVSLVNPYSRQVGNADRLAFRPIRPSVPIELTMIWTDKSDAIAADQFRSFVIDFLADGRHVEPPAAPGTPAKAR